MVKYLQLLNGIKISMNKGGKYYDKKPIGSKVVTSRHETQGTYLTITDTFKDKKIFDGHSSEKNFTWNLAHAILNLAKSDLEENKINEAKFSFKSEKPKGYGRWNWLHETENIIKLNGKKIGNIDNKEPFKIRLAIEKDKDNDDGNPNCKWMWIKLKKESKTLQEAKDFLNKFINKIIDKYRLHSLEK